MNQKKSISAPKLGMQRDYNSSDLKQTAYTLGVNVNTSNENGDSFNVQLEPSNQLGVIFPEDYKVVGFVSDLLKERTYYLLTNTNPDSAEYRKSSIGYVDNSEALSDNHNNTFTDSGCIGCNTLPEPLENTEQTPSLQYVELEHDRCIDIEDIEEKGLNFHINFPIKKIEIKQEVLGTTLYWNDWRNPFRYLQVGRLEESLEKGEASYLRILDISCEEPQELECIDVSKMLVSPNHKRMRIEAKEEQIGGNLKQGTYEFRGAYCDLQGNEMTEYCTPTNPISIWDENNYIQEQTELDSYTNYAIKLQVHNLDIETFKYYKVVVVERNNVNNTESVFLVGIYPTTDNIVTYTHSGSNSDDLHISRGNVSLKRRMTLNEINAVKPNYKRMKGTMVTDDRLFGYGLEEEEEINIQPVVNLFSGLVKAQTSVVSENLYKSPVATSKYKQFARNEVQPLGIRLLYDRGGYSSVFPFVGRPKNANDTETVSNTNKNYLSLEEGAGYCTTNTRNEKWQIFNTAEEIEGECFDLDDNSIELPPQNIQKTCFVDIETVIPSDTITVTLEDEFYDLKSYINEHIDEVCDEESPYYNEVLCEYLSDTYSEECTPSYIGECDTPELLNSVNLIDEVKGEVSELNEKDIEDYRPSVAPEFCMPYLRSQYSETYELDEEFMEAFAPTSPICIVGNRASVYKRNIDVNNTTCSYAEELVTQTNPSQALGSVIMNYDASYVQSDLIVDNSSFTTDVTGTGFLSTVHNKALFYRVDKMGRDKIVLEVTRRTSCVPEGDYLASFNNNKIRYNIYTKCSSPVHLGGAIVDLDAGHIEVIDISAFPNSFYIVVDSIIDSRNVVVTCASPAVTVYYVVPPCGCFSIYQRDIEYASATISWDEITLTKKMVYTSSCVTYLPKINDCDPIPYKKYKMAYWESTNDYPDNAELFDSSRLKIKPSHLSILDESDKDDFIEYYTEGIDFDNNYILKDSTDLRCTPIRHPKFPDNTIAPFMIDNISHKDMADSIIFPMGVNLDSKIVSAMIEVAYDNGLLTKKQKDSVVGWEIMKGDNSAHKSVISNGILIDVNKYTEQGEDIYFSNFPFNDLGNNKFCLNPANNQLIKHVFDGEKNNRFTFLSPDMLVKKTAIPSEMALQGYLFGNANIGFSDVDKHPQWTVLGNRTYRTANTLAVSELALETVIKVADMSKEGWATFGLSNGGNFGWIGAVATVGATLATAALRIGQYRYNWLTIFRDLGRTDNFASFQYGIGKHNRLLRADQYDDSYLRRLSVRKHLTDGKYSIVDENNGQDIRINHKLRENSIFLATGQQYIEYPDEYKNYDNNTVSSTSSNFLSSEINCVKKESKRDIANPYVSLKNYIPDQWDTIDSIKWLTTNYIFDLDDDTSCQTIFGGSQVISRFSWRIKVPFFDQNAIHLADKLPYLYSRHGNIGNARFYCDYETADDATFKAWASVFPDIKSDYNFDCTTGQNSYYLRPPSKFYLFTHGIIDFLVESEINCNFRYSKKQPHEQFYNGQDLESWLQETNLPISEPNTFFYNNSYSLPVTSTQYKQLDRTYDREVWKKRALKKNAWVWSERDNNENALLDQFLVFKPLNFYQDKTNRGELIDLRSIESGQFLARYEDQLLLFNQSNSVADALNNETAITGTGFLNARPISYKKADLGFAGTQNVELVSTPYGHFWVDAKRGRILQVDQNGENLQIPSEIVNGQPSGMKQWFREHLPFKLLKHYPEVDIDNKFKGIGINMWWDDREGRLFITKRDYVSIKQTSYINGDFYRLEGYEDIIESYEVLGYTYKGIEGHRMRFEKEGLPSSTDIYAFFDTTSMLQADGVSAASALNSWFVQYQSVNPEYTGNLYILCTGNEDWLNYPNLLYNGNVSITNHSLWTTINQLPPNINTANWVKPSNIVVLAFVDEARPNYHTDLLSYGFGGYSPQPTILFQGHYSTFVNNYNNNFNFFRGVVYPIPRDLIYDGGAFVLQTMASIEGTTLTQGQIDATNTTVDVSILLTENPYSALGGLKNYGWKGVYDKVSPASEVFNSDTFSAELNELIVGESAIEVLYVDLEKIELTDPTYFKDVSWTISFKPSEGTWNSYFSFYPDYSPYHNNFFQVGYNWGENEGTLWNHLLDRSSFCVFQGKKHDPEIEFVIPNENVDKMLNSVSLNIEGASYINNFDWIIDKDKSFKNMYIFNRTNNTGLLELHPQKSLNDVRKYPVTENNHQKILFTAEEGKQNINYFFNRMHTNKNIPMFTTDENGIFKSINKSAVNFTGKRVLERLKGDFFLVHLKGTTDTRFNLILKNSINNETITP